MTKSLQYFLVRNIVFRVPRCAQMRDREDDYAFVMKDIYTHVLVTLLVKKLFQILVLILSVQFSPENTGSLMGMIHLHMVEYLIFHAHFLINLETS